MWDGMDQPDTARVFGSKYKAFCVPSREGGFSVRLLVVVQQMEQGGGIAVQRRQGLQD